MNKPSRRFTRREMLLSGLAVGVAGVLPWPSTTLAQARKVGRMRVSTGIDPVYTQFYVAEAKGIYTKHGLEAPVVLFERGGTGLEAVVAGEQDAASTAEPPVIAVVAKGADVVIPSITCIAPKTIKLVAKKDIKAPADLVGRKLGAALNSTSEFVWDRYLEVHKIPEEKIKKVNVAPPESVALLERGDIDAFFFWEPWPTKALQVSGEKVHILATSDQDGVYSSTLFLEVGGPYSRQNPDGVKALLRALIEATDLIKADPEEAAQITTKRVQIKIEDTRRMVKEFIYEVKLDPAAVEALRTAEAWFRKKGITKSPIDWGKVVRPEFLRAVRPEAVTYKG